MILGFKFVLLQIDRLHSFARFLNNKRLKINNKTISK